MPAFPAIEDLAASPEPDPRAEPSRGEPAVSESSPSTSSSASAEAVAPPPLPEPPKEERRASYHDYAAFDPASWPDEPLTNAGADVLASQAPTPPLADAPAPGATDARPITESAEFGMPVLESTPPQSATPRESDVIGADAMIPSATGWDPAWDADEETAEGTGAGFGAEPLESAIDPGPDLERWDAPGTARERAETGSSAEALAWGSGTERMTDSRSVSVERGLADALERVAARFRAGELSAPRGASMSSDEAALALALSVLLGQRR